MTYTAIVSSGAGIPTGNVLFYTGGPQGTVALNSSGVASWTPPGTLLDSADPANDWGVTAIYQGNATYKSSRGSIDQTIDQAPTWTTLSSSMNLSAYGQSVTFTATLTPAEPLVSDFAGAYELFVDGQLAASGPMNSAAQFSWTTSKLSAGAHIITASCYSLLDGANTDYQLSHGSCTQVVIGLGTSTMVSSSLDQAGSGQLVTFAAHVSPGSTGSGTPTGNVTFVDGTTQLGTERLSAGTATYSTAALSPGNHSITAVYNGDSTFAPSTSGSPVNQVVALPGDANFDGKVDIADLTILLANFGRSGATWSQGNFADDPTVDIEDLTILLTSFGRTVGAPASTPRN